MTISEIARRIEELRPGTLPRLLSVGTESLWTNCADSPKFVARLPDDIARATLIGAMVMATKAARDSYGWGVMVDRSGDAWCDQVFNDSDHSDDPLLSLLAAFEAVYAKEDANG